MHRTILARNIDAKLKILNLDLPNFGTSKDFHKRGGGGGGSASVRSVQLNGEYGNLKLVAFFHFPFTFG